MSVSSSSGLLIKLESHRSGYTPDLCYRFDAKIEIEDPDIAEIDCLESVYLSKYSKLPDHFNIEYHGPEKIYHNGPNDTYGSGWNLWGFQRSQYR